MVLIGSYDGTLYALGAADGKDRWKVKTDNYVHGTPASSTASRTSPAATRSSTPCASPTARRRLPTSATAYTGASVAIVRRRRLLRHVRQPGDRVRRGQNGRVKWRYEHPDRKFPFYSSAAVTDGIVLLGGRDRMIHALDAATGKARWTHMTRARIDSSPAVAGGRVFVGSNDGRLYVLDLASGKVVWETRTAARCSVAGIASGRVVIGSTDGRVVCVG